MSNRSIILKRWLPAAASVLAVVIGAGIFHEELRHWFAGTEPAPPAAAESPDDSPKATVAPINNVCPILGNPVKPGAATVTWNGHAIGFCCPPCDADWIALNDEKKQAFVDRFAASVNEPVNQLCPILGKPVVEDGGRVEWNGHVIGFCCPPCEEDWNAFAEDKKQAFVDRALKETKTQAVAETETRPPPPADEIAFHTCSMHPSVKSKDPGTCPICKMDLAPVTHEEVREGIIFVDAKRRQLIGVTTTTVMEQTFDKEIRAVGTVTYDETRLADVSLKVDGWIGEVFADFTGKSVTEGEPLFTVYSPEILSVQQDLIDSNRANGTGSSRLAESARGRLQLLDVAPEQIEAIAASGTALHYVPIHSPATGTVIEKSAVKGSSIPAGKSIYRIADLSSLWVEADVYESDLPLVSEGLKATLTLPYLPGKTIEGEVSYVYPYLDSKTRTGRVRIVVPNPLGELKPDMFVEARLHVPLGKRLAVPEDAILYAGESNVVFIDLGEGRMRPQKIEVGVRAGELVEVLDGLKAGDTVVSSGNFLVASESKLKSGKDKW